MNQPRPTLPAWLRNRFAMAQPPFWELEKLIALGLGHEPALQRIAARRALMDRSVMADRPRAARDRSLLRDAAHG
ncbi:hypothetical protein ABIE41_000814 [Bosea sp. OAE506]|uniref:hypothetical protein n=1 Tax=Bosea sp. OAE506 TaxID=2663870 RepID=UPI00178BACF4